MANVDKPVGEIVLVGRTAFQIYSHIYRGVIQYRAKLGKPWTNHKTGETVILPFMQDDSTRDYAEATTLAAQQLEVLRTADFRQGVHKSAATTTPVTALTEKQLGAESTLELKLASG